MNLTRHIEDAGVIELQKDQEDIDMSRNDMEDKLDTVIKRVSKRGTIKYKWIVECHLDSRDIVCVLY